MSQLRSGSRLVGRIESELRVSAGFQKKIPLDSVIGQQKGTGGYDIGDILPWILSPPTFKRDGRFVADDGAHMPDRRHALIDAFVWPM